MATNQTAIALLLLSFGMLLPPRIAAFDTRDLGYAETQILTREAYLQRVLERNPVIQSRLASFGSALHLHRAESALFEPELVGSSQRIDRRRPNTIELERSLQSGGTFTERNMVYSAGVEVRTPTGGRVVVGGSARELRNNVQRTVIVDLDAEYETSFDVSVEQPLLRGGGVGIALAPREMAARNAEVSYQDFRRQLMLIVAQAEITYWELALAQEQHRLSNESVRTAAQLLADGRARLEAGRGTQLDVIEAQAGLALRESRRSQARQRLVEAMNRLAGFFNGRPLEEGVFYQASEAPTVETPHLSY
jgi:outer membrane protein